MLLTAADAEEKLISDFEVSLVYSFRTTQEPVAKRLTVVKPGEASQFRKFLSLSPGRYVLSTAPGGPHAYAHQTGLACLLGTMLQFLGGG